MQSRLAAEGFEVRRITELSRRGESPVWRLDLADGRRVKVRRLPSIAAADRVWSRLRAVRAGILARPIRRFGQTIVTEHVDGVPLNQFLRGRASSLEERMIRGVARLAAAIHRHPLFRASPTRIVEYHAFVADVAGRLARRGWLDSETVGRLSGIPLPEPASLVITHGDLCPANVIVEPDGRLRAVDEERLADRPTAFDLARIVTRWPLNVERERILLRAYERAGGDSGHFQCHRAFWKAVALSTSAVYRLHYGLPGLKPVVRDLRRLVR